ncbi:hypothetical protein LG200_05075 [Methylobacillus caricis]|uniref:phage adaptor protein n=1 Tax=Methylobacillus caricis TaxID=1971611 RepID=UPI001CFF9FA4|nr:hypothetical protein [Methylobacillus caricis]MCB5187376.1 hypothetical protein [Methylobacillus caricis]
MADSMSQADLVADFKASLHDCVGVFKAPDDADFKRILNVAALELSRYRTRTLVGEITLIPGQNAYDAPADFQAFKSPIWGISRPQPWEKNWTGPLPRCSCVSNGSISLMQLVPAPTDKQIAVLGSQYKFFYFARHVIGETANDTTIQAADRGLLILRSQAEACKEMAMRNLTKPVALRDGISNGPRNGTPSFLFQALMEQFERLAG